MIKIKPRDKKNIWILWLIVTGMMIITFWNTIKKWVNTVKKSDL
ncbi:MAG: hypothetical protein SCH70_14685 [Candidatus Methanoperedens sp.]|nr:hypothetical protein [Candidatus Methanoperedens sp.]